MVNEVSEVADIEKKEDVDMFEVSVIIAVMSKLLYNCTVHKC